MSKCDSVMEVWYKNILQPCWVLFLKHRDQSHVGLFGVHS